MSIEGLKLSGTKVEIGEGDSPRNRVYSRQETERMFSSVSSVNMFFERPLQNTVRRKGLMGRAYNYGYPIIEGATDIEGATEQPGARVWRDILFQGSEVRP